jgi:NhaP-type Na+/H+ or K+/H+ antiporter
MTTTDQIIVTIAIIAILITVINAALWLRVLIQLYREDDTGYCLPQIDIDGRDAAGSAYSQKGGSHE